ncbi:MAG TPA: ABC transporter transmembrane domain-containing protein, partial [Roseiflexaceae bacterium]|nr:ABC transporter transmembrane domain-containing protein [Roseiflexaceae bacterium]
MSVTNTPAAPVRPYRRLLGSYLRPRLGGVLLLALLLIFGITLQLVNPQVIRTFVDATQAGAAADRLMPAALLFLAIAVVQRSAAFAAVYVGERLGWGATNDLRADLARHCLRLDMGFHKRRTPGELIERIDGDVVALGNFFSQFSVQLIGNALLVLGVLLLFFREDVRVGLILSLYTMLVFAALMLLQRLATDRWAQAHQAHAEQFGFL